MVLIFGASTVLVNGWVSQITTYIKTPIIAGIQFPLSNKIHELFYKSKRPRRGEKGK